MYFFLLLLFGHLAAAHLGSGSGGDLKLDCSCDFETIFCRFEGHNCSEFSLTFLQDSNHKDCPPRRCGGDECCCSEDFSTFIHQKFSAAVRRGGMVEVETFNTTASFKPPTPTLVSVVESNGNVEVRWRTNMKRHLNSFIKPEVTFYKKGDTKKVPKLITPAMDQDLQYYAISGQELDPGTTYMIRVRSFVGWNRRFSDGSNELLISTTGSSDSLVLALALGLSVFAAFLCGAIFYCYKKAKREWWDAYSEPKVTVSHLKVPLVLTPVPLKLSVCVTEEELSKRRAAVEDDRQTSSDLGRFPSLGELLSARLSQGDEEGSGSSDMLNHTYSLLLPGCSAQRPERLAGFASSGVDDPYRPARLFPAPQPRSDTSRHPSGADGTDTARCGPLQSVEGNSELPREAAVKLENPSYGCVPPAAHQILTVNGDYQPVPRRPEPSEPSADLEHVLNKSPGAAWTKIPPPCFTPAFMNNAQNAAFYPELLLNLLPGTSADDTLTVISDYHSV